MRSLRNLVLSSAVAVLALGSTASAEVRLPHVFGDHMVLQKDKPLIFWGWANPSEKVTLTVGTASTQVTATDKGEWRAELPALTTAGPVPVKISASNTIELSDVLVGEVWICSGQSNMEMGVGASIDAKAELAAANYPGIRLFVVPKKISPTPLNDVEGAWQVCTPQTLGQGGWGGFSAAGYYFGRELHKQLNVPVGLIHTNWGGTRIEPWTPPEGFASIPSLAGIREQEQLANPASQVHKDRLAEYLASLEKWITSARTASAVAQPIPEIPKYPESLNFAMNPQTPTGLYNAMIHPLIPLGVRGVIWYQGESNHGEGRIYIDKTRAKLESWRKLWNDPNLPYYYVQIAPFQYGTEPDTLLPEFWETQFDIMSAIPHTGMVTTNDISELQDIHPKNKREVGRRLALLALNQTYGKSDIVASGPTFKAMDIQGNTLVLHFNSVGGGLVSRDGKPLSNFEIIDADTGGFVPATAEIKGGTVVLSAPSVKNPVAMRFAWNKLAEPNLSNKDGLPTPAFRAGKVPARDSLTMNVPEAASYQLAYDLNLANLNPVKYDTDNHTTITKPIDRIAYFLELTNASGTQQYIWVSMDPFTQDISKIAIPTVESNASFQTRVSNLNVISNVGSVTSGTNLASGNIEFWPNNYGVSNASNIPNASATTYDFGDQMSDPVNGYGSMQVHNFDAKQTLFAINHWVAGDTADLGIGNRPTDAPDWTFAANGASYSQKRLRVFVHTK